MNGKPLDWLKLKTNKCPKCGKDWMGSFGQNLKMEGRLMKHLCGFSITDKRYSQIVSSMVTKELAAQWDKEQEEQNEA